MTNVLSKLTKILNRLNQTACFMIGVLGKGSKNLSRIVLRRRFGNTVWSLRHLSSFWNDTGFDLVLETENVPALIKLARNPSANMVAPAEE